MLIDIANLKDVCIYMEFEDQISYICEPVNSLEFE